MLEASEAEVAALKEQAALASTDAFTRILEVLADAELRLRDAASKKILLEVTLLRAIEARNALSLDAVLKQLNQLRGQRGAGVTPRQSGQHPAAAHRPRLFLCAKPWPPTRTGRAGTNAAAPVLHRSHAAAPAPGDLAGLWTNLIDAVGRVSPFTRGYLIDAHPVSFEKNVLIIGFDPEFEDHLGLVDNARNHTLLATKLAELGHANAMIKFIKAEAPAGWDRKAAAAAPPPVPAAAKRCGGHRKAG